MPTGRKHHHGIGGGYEVCRCMIGEDHDDDVEDSDESLSVYDVTDIWLYNVMDED